MAAKYIYRKNFPILAAGAFVILQPLFSGSLAAEQQVDCKASPSGGWSCAPQDTQTQLPPRPTAPSVAAAVKQTADKPVSSNRPAKAVSTKSVAVNKVQPQGSNDFSYLDWVPREQLTTEQLAEVGPDRKSVV